MEGLTDAGVRSARPGPFGSCYPTARPEHGEGAARKAASPTTERDRGHQNPAKRCLRPRRTRRFRPTPRSLITTSTHECEGARIRVLSAPWTARNDVHTKKLHTNMRRRKRVSEGTHTHLSSPRRLASAHHAGR